MACRPFSSINPSHSASARPRNSADFSAAPITAFASPPPARLMTPPKRAPGKGRVISKVIDASLPASRLKAGSMNRQCWPPPICSGRCKYPSPLATGGGGGGGVWGGGRRRHVQFFPQGAELVVVEQVLA